MYHPEKHRIILDFIKNTDKPILGICFGCELIARAYDCELFDSGVKNVETQDICFDDKKYCFPAFEAHRFGIQKVSSQVQVIAHGQNESIEVIQHESKPIIGTQFHPEVSKNSREIFVHLLSKLKI
jgi:GMP synthase (glutamine-hydrolysing)